MSDGVTLHDSRGSIVAKHHGATFYTRGAQRIGATTMTDHPAQETERDA